MMHRKPSTRKPSFLHNATRLGALLMLVAVLLGVLPTSPALADTDDGLDNISTGLYHTCGVKTDGSLACWGYDGYGQVSGPNSSSDTFTLVSTGGYHTCALKTDGALACWGNNDYGQVSGPAGSPEIFVHIGAGSSHTCGVRTDGGLACWGYDDYGQVSGPNGSAHTFTQVSGGLYHTCGVKTDGSLACWGYDWYEQVSGPNGSSDSFTQVSAGGYHTCGKKTDHSLACWGHDWYGQVWGPNHSSDTFEQVSGGLYHTCAVKTDGRLACWGYDGDGQVSGPNGSAHTFTQVSGGGYHTSGVTTDRARVGWGNNDYGQATSSNQPPTDITLSNDTLDENQPVNTEVASLTTTDPDAADTHIYSLVSTASCSGPDNGSFHINADRLRTSAVLDFETKDSYAICIRTDDSNGGVYVEQSIIYVNNLNEAPECTVPGSQTTSTNTPLAFSADKGTLISISDVDAIGNPVKVTLTASNGTLTLNDTTNLIFTTGDGAADANMVFTSTIATINTALDGMNFNPTPGHNGPANIHIVTDDLGHTGSGGPLTDVDTVDIFVEPSAASNGSRIFLPLVFVNAPVSGPDVVASAD